MKVGGQIVTALFDTGASSSIIDQRLATTLGVSEGRLPVPGENGVGTGSVEPGVDLSLGGLTLKGLTVGVLDLAALVKTSGETWSAVLGDEVFNETIVDFDFPNRRIAFRSPVGFRPPPDAITLNLKRDGGAYLVPLSLEGGPPANFIMDTGYGGNMRISPGLAQAQHLLVGRAKTKVALEAIGGEADADMITVKTLELGGVELKNAPAQISQTWPSASFTDQEQGLLGLGILVRFRVIVDWPEDRLYLVPRPDAATLPFARDRLGLTFRTEGAQVVVTGVFENSPAAGAGFRVGDRIDLINGAPASGEVQVGSSAPGTQVVLTMASTSANRSSADKTPATVPTVASPQVQRTVLLRDYY
jgi:predicted aspartyl protease